LIDYFDQNPSSSFVKIINPLNTYETFFSTGVVDSSFKVCTSELFELFKMLWSLKTGKSQNKELYEVVFISAVKGTMYPVSQMPNSEKQLRGFQWQEKKRPKSKYELFGE
jgi:hypothetical protein